ncbi:PFE-CTERM domain-containing protein [Waterburya agarophytonicola]|uniref:PFE-CTERM domain-containing protein n=1 Tax=Waterburya agarophytonicola TaxID=2886916 RepID=UPI003F718A7F
MDFVGSGGFGAFAFSEFKGTQVQVPFEFSPTLGLLLSGVGFWGINYLKRKRIFDK